MRWRSSPSSTPTRPATATPLCYVRLAEQGELEIRGADQLAWLDRFRSDINNLRAALEWCLLTGDTTRAARLAGALAWFWTLNGMLTEAIQHLERLVESDEVPPRDSRQVPVGLRAPRGVARPSRDGS